MTSTPTSPRTPSTPRTPRQRLQIRRNSDAPPIPPRLRGRDMLWTLRLNPTLHSDNTPPTTQHGQWFDDDEFSIQGPHIALSPVSTATIHFPTTHAPVRRPSPPNSHPHRTCSMASHPVHELSSPAEFPFPEQPATVEMAMEGTSSGAELAKKSKKPQKSKK